MNYNGFYREHVPEIINLYSQGYRPSEIARLIREAHYPDPDLHSQFLCAGNIIYILEKERVWKRDKLSSERYSQALRLRVVEKKTYGEIGKIMGVGRARAAQLVECGRKKDDAAKRRLGFIERALGRPIDMGGPRDVWLTFYPSPDPRLDNMEPSQVTGVALQWGDKITRPRPGAAPAGPRLVAQQPAGAIHPDQMARAGAPVMPRKM